MVGTVRRARAHTRIGWIEMKTVEGILRRIGPIGRASMCSLIPVEWSQPIERWRYQRNMCPILFSTIRNIGEYNEAVVKYPRDRNGSDG